MRQHGSSTIFCITNQNRGTVYVNVGLCQRHCFTLYPTSIENWTQLAMSGRDVSMGTLDGPGRQIRLAIIAVQIEVGSLLSSLLDNWEGLRPSLV